MKVVKVYTPAKINLTLQVFHKRPDGFHEIETAMQAVDVWDTIKIRVQGAACRGNRGGSDPIYKEKENEIVVKCAPKKFHVPENENNLCYKAADLFLKEAAVTGSKVHISIRKKIPPGSGLGGGSGNAAGCLAALNTLHENPFTKKKLFSMAERIGSDVPYFLHGGLAVCKGRGELISPRRGASKFFAILVLPDFSLSTKEVYSHLPPSLTKKKGRDGGKKTYGASLIDSIRKKSIIVTGKALQNDLEKSGLTAMKKITAMKRALLLAGARGVLMSGSGSCVYGIFGARREARRAQKLLQSSLKSCTIILTRPISGGVRLCS